MRAKLIALLFGAFPLFGNTLDTTKIHALYADGDFAEAISMLDKARKSNELQTHADSVFAYKHLGVMYAAKYETMEKGKQFMYRLLSIEPTIKIMDMYASDMIYMIFRNVQSEFEIRRARPKDSTQEIGKSSNPNDQSVRKPKPKISEKATWPYWTAGAILAGGAGISAYLLLSETPSEPKRFEGGL